MKTYTIECKDALELVQWRTALQEVIRRQGHNPLPELVALYNALLISKPLKKSNVQEAT